MSNEFKSIKCPIGCCQTANNRKCTTIRLLHTQQFNANRHTRSFHLGEKESFAKIAFSIYADKQLSRVMAPNDFRISFKCFPCERFCLLLMAQVASTTKHDDTFARFSLFLFFFGFFSSPHFLFLFVFGCVLSDSVFFAKQFCATQSI